MRKSVKDVHQIPKANSFPSETNKKYKGIFGEKKINSNK